MNNDDNYPYGDDKNVPPPRTSQQAEGVYGYREGGTTPRQGRRISIRTILALVVLIMAVVVWIAYPDGDNNYDDAELPLVRADNTPYKTAPETRGGEEVPYQDSTIFEAMESNDSGENVELLLPTEESQGERARIIRGSEGSLVQQPNMNLDVKLTDTESEREIARIVDVPDDMPASEPASEASVDAENEASTATSVSAKEETSPIEEPVNTVEPETTPTDVTPFASGSHYIQLGAFRGQAEAENAYQQAVKKYGSILAGADVKYERADLGAKGIYSRVKVGPMAESDAKNRCERIQDIQSGACFVAR